MKEKYQNTFMGTLGKKSSKRHTISSNAAVRVFPKNDYASIIKDAQAKIASGNRVRAPSSRREAAQV